MMAVPEDRQEDRPATLATTVLSVALATVALGGLSGAVSVVVVLLFFAHHFVWGSPTAWRTVLVFAVSLLIGGAALWGLMRLRPWRRWAGPVSPATRRSNILYWLKEGLALVAMLALFFGAASLGHPTAAISNGPIPPWVAIVAGLSWLVARVLREWWRNSSDEHEQRASDTGRNAAAGIFLAVTPVWWVAWRAGFLPQPDAMVLWILVMVVSSIGWSWRRYN
jgi:hypothetical protein